MKNKWILVLLIGIGLIVTALIPARDDHKKTFGLAIHGGAGTITKQGLSAEKETLYRKTLEEALNAGYAILEKGGASLDAVVAAVQVMENSPLFNAGKGAVFTSEGKNELDASIMDGKTLNAGAVAGIRHIRSPIQLARLVMEKSPHVMLAGEGAEAFAREQGLEMVDEKYFFTEDRWKSLQRTKEREKKEAEKDKSDESKGTVGAVALDQSGNLAAATSTGGMTNKRWGRIGDAPIIGAGTYAANGACAISCTGWGEYFIRSVVAYDIVALITYKHLPLEKAAQTVLKKVADLGGDGGLIGIDREGNVTMPFNTAGMFRGFRKSNGDSVVKLYPGE